MSKVYKKINK